MPELPEVETTRRGIAPALRGEIIQQISVFEPRLRYPVPERLVEESRAQRILDVSRRAKYLVISLSQAYILIHLGMSGSLRLLKQPAIRKKHDHIDLQLINGTILRYNDPRKFGLWLYDSGQAMAHPLLKNLGPEPLSQGFDADYLQQKAKNKTQAVKSFIMRNEIVVGIGNIYATEILFHAGIHPETPAGKLSAKQWQKIAGYTVQVLEQALAKGGTTLKDFSNAEGKPGYFAQALSVYGRQNKACLKCQSLIQSKIIGGRNSAFCPSCQNL